MLRYDMTTNDWVVFSPTRALRPDDFRRSAATAVDESASEGTMTKSDCPFCPGNESKTPPEIFAHREKSQPNSPGWLVRVTPNKFPALRIEEDHRRLMDESGFRFMGGCGAHEVIVDSPDHFRPLALQPVEQISLILRTMHQRYNDLMRDSRFQTIVIFKNHGARAGTSLSHPHCQLIATAVVPHMLRQKMAVAAQYFDQTGDCLYRAMMGTELKNGQRIVAANDSFVALLPYASHVPFETWILPRIRQSSFHWLDPSLLRPLAELLRTVLGKIHTGLADPAFNLTIDTAPRGEEDAEYFHWHLRILPRLTTPAGFELGSGMSINTVFPEEAADFLRRVTPMG